MSVNTGTNANDNLGAFATAKPATAPSLTDPTANVGMLNQIVQVGTDTYAVDFMGNAIKLGSAAAAGATVINWYDVTTDPAATGNTASPTKLLPRWENNTANGTRWLVDSNGVAKKVYSAPTALTPELAPVRDFLTQAQIDALAAATPKPNDQTSYIVKDGTHKGDIATWDAATGEWIYYVPKDLDVTTVTNPDNEVDLGKWRYDIVGDYWVQISTQQTIPDVVERPVSAENIAFGRDSNIICNNMQAGRMYAYIQNDQVAIWGNTTSFTNGTSASAEALFPRYVSANWYDGSAGATPYAPAGQYRPKFVDVVTNLNNMLSIDHLGKVWGHGNKLQGLGITTTPLGTVAAGQAPTTGLMPIPFWQAQTNVFASRVFLNNGRYDCPVSVGGVLTTDSDLYLTGDNQYGELGQGDVTARANWVKYPVGNIVDVKMVEYTVLTLDAAGDLRVTGYFDLAGGLTTNSTPRLLLSGVAQFDVHLDAGLGNIKDVLCTMRDGKLKGIGQNATGILGVGFAGAVTTFKEAIGVNNAKAVFCSKYAGNGTAGLIRTDGTLSLAGQNTGGCMGYTPDTAATPHYTFVTPAFAAQGTVVEGMIGQVTTVRTASGNIWNAGPTSQRGLGFDNNTWANANKFQQVLLPEPALAMRGSVANAATGYNDNCWVLTASHGIVCWGGSYPDDTNNSVAQYVYSPRQIPQARYLNNGITISDPLGGKYDKTGTITAITAASIGNMFDGSNGSTNTQYMTVTLTTDGTIGKVDTTGATLTGSAFTATNQTSYVYQVIATGNTIKLVFKVTATDIIATGGAAVTQSYTVSVGGQIFSFTGNRTNDILREALTTSLASYDAASALDPVAITAAEYATLAGLTGAFKAANTDAAYAAVTNYGGATTATTRLKYNLNVTAATPAFDGGYPVAFKYKVGVVGEAQNQSTVQLGYGATTGAGTAVSNNVTPPATVVPDANRDVFFIIKSPSVQPAAGQVAQFKWPASYAWNNTRSGNGVVGAYDALVAPTFFNNASSQTFQVITLPTKQWA